MAHLYRVPHRVHLQICAHGTSLARHAPSRKLHLICTAEQARPGDSAEDSTRPPEAQRAKDALGQSVASNREAAVQDTIASVPLTEVQGPIDAAADLGKVPAAAPSVADAGMASTQQNAVGGEMIGCGANRRPSSSKRYAFQALAFLKQQVACLYDCMHCWHCLTAHSLLLLVSLACVPCFLAGSHLHQAVVVVQGS